MLSMYASRSITEYVIFFPVTALTKTISRCYANLRYQEVCTFCELLDEIFERDQLTGEDLRPRAQGGRFDGSAYISAIIVFNVDDGHHCVLPEAGRLKT